MVEFKNVNVKFKQQKSRIHAVKDASFSINKGEIFGIVGASGAGKSTLIRTINLLQPITSGEIIVNGENIEHYRGKRLRILRQDIGMIFQHFNLASSQTVFNNIAFALHAAKWRKANIEKRVKELLEFVNLSDKTHEYPSKLSGGQKQRVAIARALANNTNILLCDEPTSALDAEATASMLALLKEINQKLGITIILITHELDVVKTICNRVAVMNQGSVVEIGDVYEVFTNPQDDFTRRLIAHTERFELPAQITNDLQGPTLKLTYRGEKATKSVLSKAGNKFGIDFNILHGKIEYIDSKPLGILYVNINGEDEKIANTIGYLKKEIIDVEVIANA